VSEPPEPHEVIFLQSLADRDAGVGVFAPLASAIATRTARAAADRIAAMPPRVQRALRVATVRCPGGAHLARVYRIPPTTDGGPARYVLIPTRRSHAVSSNPRAYPALGVPCWIEKDSDVVFRLYCRCHAETQLTASVIMHNVADSC
jgi:hypothetical protein